MRCPSCGAISKKRSMKCPECGAFRNKSWVDTEPTPAAALDSKVEPPALTQPRKERVLRSLSLIEFPGATRHAIPEWRKELGERVREVQERRAREASIESGESANEPFSDEPRSSRPLELLAKPSIPPTNPLVIAALRRIERAHARAQFSGNAAVATAVYEEQPDFDLQLAQVEGDVSFVAEELPTDVEPIKNDVAIPGKTHNLTVVAAPVTITPEEADPELELEPEPLPSRDLDLKTTIKPTRLIRDNDPALDYLDSVPTTVIVDLEQRQSAPVFFRAFCAILDLVIIGMLAAPVLAVVKLTELHWRDPRVIAFAAGTVVVAAFLYLTVNTALAGRTLAMRLFSLRVVDERTGLIPTGTQAAGRAVLYLLSLAAAGIGLMFVFVDRENRTAHDRFTRTAVVRV